MDADPILLTAGKWLGAASGVLALTTIAGYFSRWGIRFRLVGVTSFTALLAVSCLTFAVSYSPRVQLDGAVNVPVVFDNGIDLVVAAAPEGLADEAAAPTVQQVAQNLRGGGRSSADNLVHVRLRRVEPIAPGLSKPVVLAEASRSLISGDVQLQP
ncbi:MAG: Ycf51 family protein [Cyanobacteria bacterium]|nr:Ycf51 family protein [Cyanobacteriota bacterium]MDA1247171.1 Ycf51 family protein [Cyanobacteriota bacterium]